MRRAFGRRQTGVLTNSAARGVYSLPASQPSSRFFYFSDPACCHIRAPIASGITDLRRFYSFLADYGLAAVGNDWKGSRLPQRQTIYLDPFGGGDSLSRANRQTVIFKTIRGLVRLSRVPYLATMGEPASLH
jgi:hypothetical protein